VSALPWEAFLATLSGTTGFTWSWCRSAGDTALRGSGNGSDLAAGSSLRTGAISERPIARLHGSTAAGLEPKRAMRSAKLAFFFSGPEMVAVYPMGRKSTGAVVWAYEAGLTDADLPALLGSPE